MTQTIIDKLERADGPDRELDNAIGAMLNTGRRTDWRYPGYPHYTAFVDEALQLVPKGYFLELKGPRASINIPSPVPNFWSAYMDNFNHENGAMGWGPTPALALCIAALRARSQGGE